MKLIFKLTDPVLPTLDLPDPCPIRVEIRDDSLLLYIGQRDYQWDFQTEELIGCGTRLVEEDEGVR